jgi:hypothetical protein
LKSSLPHIVIDGKRLKILLIPSLPAISKGINTTAKPNAKFAKLFFCIADIKQNTADNVHADKIVVKYVITSAFKIVQL